MKFSGRKLGCLLVLLPLLWAAGRRHDFHNSLTELTYNPRKHTFEIAVKLFTDDLEKALSARNGGKRFIIHDEDANDAAIVAYVQQHFRWQGADGQLRPYKYIGRENELDATWIYFEMPFAERTLEGCRIQQSALTDLFDDQQNLLNLTFGKEKKSFLFNERVKVRNL